MRKVRPSEGSDNLHWSRGLNHEQGYPCRRMTSVHVVSPLEAPCHLIHKTKPPCDTAIIFIPVRKWCPKTLNVLHEAATTEWPTQEVKAGYLIVKSPAYALLCFGWYRFLFFFFFPLINLLISSFLPFYENKFSPESWVPFPMPSLGVNQSYDQGFAFIMKHILSMWYVATLELVQWWSPWTKLVWDSALEI